MFQDVLLQTFWELHSCPELFAFYSVSQVLLAKAKPLPHCRLLGSKGWSHFLLAAWTSGILPNCYSPCSPSFSSYSDSFSPSSSTTPTLSSDYPDTEAFIFILLPACWTHLQTCLFLLLCIYRCCPKGDFSFTFLVEIIPPTLTCTNQSHHSNLPASPLNPVLSAPLPPARPWLRIYLWLSSHHQIHACDFF